MTDPKRRDPAALRARQRQRQAGGPHDEGRTRGEEERMAIEEQLPVRVGCECGATLGEWHNGVSGSMGHRGDCPAWGEPPNQAEHRKVYARIRDLAAENAELRARLERVEVLVGEMPEVEAEHRRLARAAETEGDLREAAHQRGSAIALYHWRRDLRAALDGGGEMGEGGE